MLSACNTTSYLFGSGKVSADNLLLTFNLMLQVYTDPKALEEDRTKDFFISLYYGKTKESVRKLHFKPFSVRKYRSKEQ